MNELTGEWTPGAAERSKKHAETKGMPPPLRGPEKAQGALLPLKKAPRPAFKKS
jgi:hypothetical protein